MKTSISKGVLLKQLAGILALVVFAYISLLPIGVQALDEAYIGDGAYWYQKGECTEISNDGFEGFIKYYADEINGCVYFYVCFTDTKIKNNKNEDICLGFTIENNLHKYSLSINRDGLTELTDSQAKSNINVNYDFSNFSCKSCGGELFAAIEMKNKEDKRLSNKIECIYSRNQNNHITLKSDIMLNTTVTDTAPASSEITKESTTHKSSNKATEKQSSSANSKTVKASTTAKTKFTASTKTTTDKAKAEKSKSEATSKKKSNATQGKEKSAKEFNPAKSKTQNNPSESDKYNKDKSTSQTEINDSIYYVKQDNNNSKMSKDAKICLATSIGTFSSGLIVMAISLFGGRYKIVHTPSSENDTQNKL
ncbi:MAG: hypothetical protein ACI4RR_07920 [Eubacterium sp.]